MCRRSVWSRWEHCAWTAVIGVRALALTLLTYLSLQGPTSRRRLRELFWPQAQDAGASLRMVLGQFRRCLPGVLSGEETLEAAVESDAALLLGLGES